MVGVIKTWLVRLSWVAMIALLLVLVTVFSQQNPQTVALQLFAWQSIPVSVSTWLIMAFIGGGFCGLLVGLGITLKLKLSNASLSRKLRRRDAEIQTLRANALKGLSE